MIKRSEGSADKPNAERIARAPNDPAPARGTQGHESDIQPAFNLGKA
jgi:hypothetical protein